jgi:hypothetical protein
MKSSNLAAHELMLELEHIPEDAYEEARQIGDGEIGSAGHDGAILRQDIRVRAGSRQRHGLDGP